jgi:hypothetical protein
MSPLFKIPFPKLPKCALLFLFAFSAGVVPSGLAQGKPDCSGLPDATRLKSVLQTIVRQGSAKNSGLGNQEWAVIVNRDGVVCAVTFSGTARGDQWPGSRIIAGEKASTANALSGRDSRFQRPTFTRRHSLAKAYTVSSRARRQIRTPFSAIPPPLAR